MTLELLVIAGFRNELAESGIGLELEPGVAVFNAQSLGLIGSGDNAAVIVGEHHHRLSLQLWVEGALTRDVERVHVNEGRRLHLGAWEILHRMRPGLEPMEAAGNDAPDAELGKLRDNHVRVSRILGSETHASVLQPQPLDGQFPIDDKNLSSPR